MVPKNERLSRKEVEYVLAHGKRIRGALFSLTTHTAPDSKFAVVVSKKTARSAVLRNKIRRRTYTAIHHILPNIKNKHCVVFVGPNIVTARVEYLTHELQHLLGL